MGECKASDNGLHEWVDITDFDSDHDEEQCIHCGVVTITPPPGLFADSPVSTEPDEKTAVEEQLLAMVRERDKEIKSLRSKVKRLEGEIRGYVKSIARLKEQAGLKDKGRYRNRNHQGRRM